MAEEKPVVMSEEQFRQLLGRMSPKDRSRWDKVVDQMLGALVTALVIGFLGLVWKGVSTIEDLRHDTDSSLKKIMGIADVYGRDLSELRANQITQTGQVAMIVHEMKQQRDAISDLTTSIQRINDRFAGLPQGSNTAASVETTKSDLVIPKLSAWPSVEKIDPEKYQELIRQREKLLREQLQTQQQQLLSK